jgi:hypothetical protein
LLETIIFYSVFLPGKYQNTQSQIVDRTPTRYPSHYPSHSTRHIVILIFCATEILANKRVKKVNCLFHL